MLRLTDLFGRLLDLVFPERCAGCGGAGGLLCPACLARLRPYPPEGPTPGLDGMSVAWLYDGPVRQAVHHLKYRRRRRVAEALGDALAASVGAPPADALVPVPLHAGRLAERGFNQAEELARRLGRRWGLPICASGLARGRDTGHQARLGRADRQVNVAGAFIWRGPGAPPARVLLVDDVLTTGATLAACAEALRAAGAHEVRAVALARSLARPGGTDYAKIVKSQQP
ncbi:MAG: ComF family protein [Chloroflexales bacterium]|nr:ComF family protein [Chloroflexales bacterium]